MRFLVLKELFLDNKGEEMVSMEDLVRAIGKLGFGEKEADYLVHLTQVNRLEKILGSSFEPSDLKEKLVKPFEEYFDGKAVEEFIAKYPEEPFMVQYAALPSYLSELRRDLGVLACSIKEEDTGSPTRAASLNIKRINKMIPSYLNLIKDKLGKIKAGLSPQVEPLKAKPEFYERLYKAAGIIYNGLS